MDHSTPAPPRGNPLALTGTAVVLGYTETGGGIDHIDVWRPEQGGYVPSWEKTTHVGIVIGAAPDGRPVLGQVTGPRGGKQLCLAELDPARHLQAVRTACGLSIQAYPHGSVSPDGHRLALLGAGPSGYGEIVVVDLRTVFERPVPVANWDAELPGVWVDADTMVAKHRDGGLRTSRIGRPGAEPTAVQGISPGTRFELVPRLG